MLESVVRQNLEDASLALLQLTHAQLEPKHLATLLTQHKVVRHARPAVLRPRAGNHLAALQSGPVPAQAR